MNKLLTVSTDGKQSVTFFDSIDDIQVIHIDEGVRTERWYSIYTNEGETFKQAAIRILSLRYSGIFEPIVRIKL